MHLGLGGFGIDGIGDLEILAFFLELLDIVVALLAVALAIRCV